MEHEIHTLCNHNYKLNLVVHMLKTNSDAVPNVDGETLFESNDLKCCYKPLMSKGGIPKEEIMGYIFLRMH